MSAPTLGPHHDGDVGIPDDEMALPVGLNELVDLVQNREGLDQDESQLLAHVALQQLRSQHRQQEGPVTANEVIEAIKVYAIRELMEDHRKNLRRQGREEVYQWGQHFLRGENGQGPAPAKDSDHSTTSEEDSEEDTASEDDDTALQEDDTALQEDDTTTDKESDQDTASEEADDASSASGSVEATDDGDSSEWGEGELHVSTETEIIDGLARLKFTFTDEALQRFFGGRDPYLKPSDERVVETPDPEQRDILTALCSHPVLAVELGKHLAPRDMISLFLSCRTFHTFIHNYMLSSIRTWTAYRFPKAGATFPYRLYKPLLMSDPRGRAWDGEEQEEPEPKKIRSIPGLKYYHLLWTRDRCSRDIVAIMARNGHRLPKTMYTTLLRMWLLMDLSTNTQRRALMHNKEIWTDIDLYNAQLFFVKLGMHFNDPVYGPNTLELLHLMMGQRGLYPLWQLLMRKRFTTLPEILQLKVQYDMQMPPDHWGHDYYGREIHDVPFHEVGTGHYEGWGKGSTHLQRLDELVPLEAVLRGLELDKHLPHMILWGYFDWKTGENLVPTEEEMYIPDEEKALEHMDTTHHWKKRHVMKKRWAKLTKEERQTLIEDDADENLRAQAWMDEDADSDSDEGAPYNPNDEIARGYVMPPCPANHESTVPPVSDKEGWQSFIGTALIGMAPELDEDEVLCAQAWQEYGDDQFEDDFDWEEWLGERENQRAMALAVEGANAAAEDDDVDNEEDENTATDDDDDDNEGDDIDDDSEDEDEDAAMEDL
ncbi:unnamed protein product [Clonostachys chloroleuca]|uniref:Uncharacterized protein n=1 Tax=Clonostachys chloroleuca TaxID=1926264 RepID=A0AA35VN97_9HYPO|nr:unnamed protein product [Clonostachys chloroleuca]